MPEPPVGSVLILANGEPPSSALAKKLAAVHERILVTDGAVNRLEALGITAHTVCGDFDSVTPEMRERWHRLEWIETPDQNHGDLEKTVQIALEMGARKITITGAGGGRQDHMLANYALLLRYCPAVEIAIADDGGTVGAAFAPATTRLAVNVGDTVSIIAAQQCRAFATGLKWELPEVLEPGTRAVSNVATAESVEIAVTSGSAFICHLARNP